MFHTVNGYAANVTEPAPRDEILTGRNEATPFRALNRVFLVCLAAFLIVGGLAFGLWEAFK
jgi:hypothetical protein